MCSIYIYWLNKSLRETDRDNTYGGDYTISYQVCAFWTPLMNWKKLSSMAFRLLMFIILMVEPTSDLIKTYKSNLNRTGVSSLVVSFVPLRNSRWFIPHPERPCATQKEFLHSRGVFRKVCKAMVFWLYFINLCLYIRKCILRCAQEYHLVLFLTSILFLVGHLKYFFSKINTERLEKEM